MVGLFWLPATVRDKDHPSPTLKKISFEIPRFIDHVLFVLPYLAFNLPQQTKVDNV
jgi:hypothetical protein